MRSDMTKYLAVLGLAGAALAMATTPSSAQYYRGYRGPESYGGSYASAEPGRCWVQTDLARGYGYWGSCKSKGHALGAASGQFKTRNLPIGPR